LFGEFPVDTISRPKTYIGDLANLPPALIPLTEQPRWVLWRWELRKDKDGKSKWTKPPLQPNGAYAKNNDPATWTTYTAALDAVEAVDADGIGYQLLGERLAAIDLDDCRDESTGRVDAWAQTYLDQARASGAYVEITPSGTGFRIIGLSDGPALHNRHAIQSAREKAGIEIYRNLSTGRYITITGCEVGDCSGLPKIDTDIPRDGGSPSRAEEPQQNGNGIDRSADFHSEVWRLATHGLTIAEIVQALREHPAADKYGYRLADEVLRSYAKWQDRKQKTRTRFTLIRFVDLKPGDEPEYLVHGLIPAEGFGVIWGPPKQGKSFWIFDLLMHVALGWKYRERDVQRRGVVYCAFEGATGFKKRAEAFRKARPGADEAEFYLIGGKADLINDHQQLIADIREQTGEVGAVCLDTLNRSLVGSENKDEDMTKYIAAADAIREAFPGSVVIVVHHCGIKGDRPRGHTSLTGAVDFQFKVSKNLAGHVLTEVEWMKEGEEGEVLISRLESMEVHQDKNGKPITSCVVMEETGSGPQKGGKQRPLALAEKIAMRALVEAVERHGNVCLDSEYIPALVKTVTEDEWRETAYKMGISEASADARKKAFGRARDRLIGDQIACTYDQLYWIASNVKDTSK
jgi:hypothetical protein